MSTSANTLNTPEKLQKVIDEFNKKAKEYAIVQIGYSNPFIMEYDSAIKFLQIMQKTFLFEEGHGATPVKMTKDFRIEISKISEEQVALYSFASATGLTKEEIKNVTAANEKSVFEDLFP